VGSDGCATNTVRQRNNLGGVVMDKDIKTGLQLFTSWIDTNSKFQKTTMENVTGKMNSADYLEEWQEFVHTYKNVNGIISPLPYFNCAKKVGTGNGWGVGLVGPKSILPKMAGIMLNVGLMKRYKSMMDSSWGTAQAEGKLEIDSMILVDVLVYETLEGKWKGSGDSRAAEKIENVKDHTVDIDKIKEENWESLIAKMCWGSGAEPLGGGDFRTNGPEPTSIGQPSCGDNTIGGWKTGKPKQTFPSEVKQFLLHFYFLRETKTPTQIWGSVDVKKFQWDHIIPESSIHSRPSNDQNRFGNNLTNCCAFPNSKNLNKSNHHLNSTHCLGPKLHPIIETYTGIDKTDQSLFPNASKLEKLCIFRGKKLIDQFLNARKF